jgi:hypothetical protein
VGVVCHACRLKGAESVGKQDVSNDTAYGDYCEDSSLIAARGRRLFSLWSRAR